jgi:hypothetical protein
MCWNPSVLGRDEVFANDNPQPRGKDQFAQKQFQNYIYLKHTHGI